MKIIKIIVISIGLLILSPAVLAEAIINNGQLPVIGQNTPPDLSTVLPVPQASVPPLKSSTNVESQNKKQKQKEPVTKPGSYREFVFNPKTHRWYAYENGELINSGPASGGANYCPDIKRSCHTPSGTYSIIQKGTASCKSTRYPLARGGLPRGGAKMPYCMFFSNYYAIHGSYEVSTTKNISHGCIRVYPDAARWLSQNFIRIGTKVVVKPY